MIRTWKILWCSTMLLLGCCGNAMQNWDDRQILIVYLSRTKNTEAVALMIKERIGGDLEEIQLEKPYPDDYRTTVDQVARENRSGYLPPLKTKIDLEDYDLIFIGFPTWGMQLPPPIKSFLKMNDFSGKTVVPFNTHAGYGVGSGFEQINEMSKGAEVLKGFSTKGGIERDGILLDIKGGRSEEVGKELDQWLKNIAIKREDKQK